MPRELMILNEAMNLNGVVVMMLEILGFAQDDNP